MSRVEEGLSAIAEMVAVELGSDRTEVDLWKELMRAVDVKRFQRTGEIVFRERALEVAYQEIVRAENARREAIGRLQYNPRQVHDAMERLRRGVRAAKADRSSRPRRVTVLLEVEEPNYDSADTELWLYGPLS